jgi:hypothetical protein
MNQNTKVVGIRTWLLMVSVVAVAAVPGTLAQAQQVIQTGTASSSSAAGSSTYAIPYFDGSPIPSKPTPKPSRADWEKAALATEVRITQPGCHAKRIHEWYRIQCDHIAIEMISGNREEVEFGGLRDIHNLEDWRHEKVWLIFPARKGDVRFFQFYNWARWSPGVADASLSEQWLENDPFPLITVQGMRKGI